jgi:hypothetical protein
MNRLILLYQIFIYLLVYSTIIKAIDQSISFNIDLNNNNKFECPSITCKDTNNLLSEAYFHTIIGSSNPSSLNLLVW